MSRRTATHPCQPQDRIPRAVFSTGEVAALLGTSPPRVHAAQQAGALRVLVMAGPGQARYDRFDVERLLAARLSGEHLEEARRLLVRLAFDEVALHDRTQLVERASTQLAPTSCLLDEELQALIVECADHLGEPPTAEAYDAWATTHGHPRAFDLTLRLAEWSWRRLVDRALNGAVR